MPEPIDELDDVVHQRIRLGILTICHEARRVEFSYLQGALELTAGNLSRHLQVLEESRLIEIEKTFEAKRPKTWVAITRVGIDSLEREIDALRQIVLRVDAASARHAKTQTQPTKPRRGIAPRPSPG